MEDSKRKGQPTMLQLRYLTELEHIEKSRGFIQLIAARSGVSHAAVSKYMKQCMRAGLLNADYDLTEAGRTWLHAYQKLVRDLTQFLRDSGVPEQEVERNVQALIENVDARTIQVMIQSRGQE